ncbi:MAG TPA: SpoIIE family protein phosphatase [Pseudonocardiaceae bacterium]|nr:SpoIIE family protein phosphatase [Pseudonocardiaceae bacterium]
MRPNDQTFRWEGLAHPESLGGVRRAIKVWGANAGLSRDLISSVMLATYEAMANAADHAYRHDELGPVIVTIARDADTVTASVSDQGTWRSPRQGGFGGRGLLLMEGMVDELTLMRTGRGTTVLMKWTVEPEPLESPVGPTGLDEDLTEDRLRGIQAITDPALAHLDMDAMTQEMLTRIREVLGADTATVLQYDVASEQLIATAAIGIEEEVRQGVRVPLGLGFAGTVAARQKPLIVDHVDETTVLNPLLWETGLHTLLGVPMLAGGRLMGVLHIGSRAQRSFAEHEVGLLQLAADRLALTTQAQVSRAERAAATALQHSLLPARLPNVSGFDFAARYVPSAQLGVGGDWYDVFPLPGDRVGIVIGDVSGHGLAAAVVMGRLRSALRAYALDNESPSVVLDKLDRKANHFEAGVMATVAYGVIDLAAHRLHLCLAGHLPPVIAVPGAPAEFVDLAPDPPIGFDLRTRSRRSKVVDLPPGAVICFYTDGLIERRTEALDDSLAALLGVVSTDRAEITCARLMSRFVGTQSLADDVAVLVVHRDAKR